MMPQIRTVQHIKTMTGVADDRRKRTTAEAFRELSMLSMEKHRLELEIQREERRGAAIRLRLTDIGNKSVRLQNYIDRPIAGVETFVGPDPRPTPLRVHPGPGRSLKRRVLAY